MKDAGEIVARWEEPGMRVRLEERGAELWYIEETAYDTFMLLMEEYYKTAAYCIDHDLPLPQSPDKSFEDKTIIAIRISESLVGAVGANSEA